MKISSITKNPPKYGLPKGSLTPTGTSVDWILSSLQLYGLVSSYPSFSAHHALKSQPLTSTAGHSRRGKKSAVNRRSKQIRSTSRSYSRRKNYYDRPKYRY